MPKATKSRKRRSDEMTDTENHPPLPQSEPAASTAASLTTKAMRALNLDIEATNLEVQSRCEALLSAAEGDVANIKQALARQLLRLPPRVRIMSVRDFALLHSLSVSSVALEGAHRHQQQLDQWVQATPRLNRGGVGGAIAGTGGRRELQSLISQPSSLQPYMNLLNTTQRMTRATARKAGLTAAHTDGSGPSGASSVSVLSELRGANGSNAGAADHSHVFQTPSGRVR